MRSVKCYRGKSALEIGVGSGIVLKALRENFKIVAGTDIDFASLRYCKENLSKEIMVACCDAASAFHYRFDLIVSNPPYFINSLLPPSAHRQRTRHTGQLTFQELITHSIRLLNPAGTLSVILPSQEGNNFKDLALKNELHVKRQLAFYSRKEKPQERWLFEFGFEPSQTKSEELVLYETGNVKSDNYVNLTKDFYL